MRRLWLVFSRPMTVAELIDRYIEGYVRLYNRDLTTKLSRLETIRARLGAEPAADITPAAVKAYMAARLAEGRSNATVNRELAVIKHLFAWAANPEQALVRENVLASVAKLAETKPTPREDLEEAIAAVFSFLPDRVEPPLIFMRETGCRKGEALSLRRDQVYLLEKLALVPITKSGKPRYLPLNQAAVAAVLTQPARSEHVFYNPKTRRRWSDLKRVWNEAREKAGHPELRMKDLRTAFAMRLADTPGIEKHVIQTILGHSSLATTENFYAFHNQRRALKRYLELVEPGGPEAA